MANPAKDKENGPVNGSQRPSSDLKSPDKKDVHQRTYQACIPCRLRKVKCFMGPVDNPHEPPCQRCRREGKKCTFDAERRKKRPGEAEGVDNDENGKRPRMPNRYSEIGANGQSAQNGVNESPFEEHEEESDDPQEALRSAAVLQSGRVYSQNDALELLYQAAHHRTNSNSTAHPSSTQNTPNLHNFASPRGGINGATAHISTPPIPIDFERESAAKFWHRTRFIRAGWFTADEGIAYIEYYYANLHSLSPIAIPDYSSPKTHQELLENEPILALTLLTIASRYKTLSGPGGISRSPHVHQRLTDTLQTKINRIIWGQKQFGGGFCRAGARQSSKVKTLWEDLGTIESLMLLTEWHPRSLHFPPGDDDGELLVPSDPLQLLGDGSEPIRVGGGSEGRRVDSWLEPCWRSDRMCWMLLNIAHTLAVESGIFDNVTDEVEFKLNNPELSDEKVKLYFKRKNYLKDLLPVYLAATSGRLELTANLPRSFLKDIQNESQPSSRLWRRLKQLGHDPGLSPSMSLLSILNNYPTDAVIHFWSEITLILDDGNARVYSNRRRTRELVENGGYIESMKSYKPLLEGWQAAFKACTAIPRHMRYILQIEYEYSRAFLYLLSLHAIVMRCTRNSQNTRMGHLAHVAAEQRDRSMSAGPGGPTTDNNIPSHAFKPQDFNKFIGVDEPWVKEITEACRNVFDIVVNGLLPGGGLKHCPVRTYFRIISSALILLKTFMVGSIETEVGTSLSLMDRAVKAMKTCIVDDVHVGNRFAEMADSLTRRIRGRFVRIAPTAGSLSRTSRADTPARGDTAMAPPSGLGAMPNLASTANGLNWTSALNTTNGSNPMISGRAATPNPALWGVPDQVYDINSHNMAVLPPPTEYYANFDNYDLNGTATNPGDIDGLNSASIAGLGDGTDSFMANSGPPIGDWLTIPYDSLLVGGEISATSNGPQIGGQDMLDRLLFTGE